MSVQELIIEYIVVGSGAAGSQTALKLHQAGETDLAVITKNIKARTSGSTGSDKQAHYKLSLTDANQDSVRTMAEGLFAGGCVDGDLALCEAALSTRCFFCLADLGASFPCTEYGEFMGYKTDHDRERRAISAGPYTSRFMTECLGNAVKRRGIRILDGLQMVRLLVRERRLYGILYLDKNNKVEVSYLIIWCRDVILATGGPAGMYHDSVYPISQLGASGMAFGTGAIGKNLTEWQFEMALLKPRWNVSGIYMQVSPTFISTDAEGEDEKELLLDHFGTPEEMLSLIFLKGYQWPFDMDKVFGGSSPIDLLVYQETISKGRRVYLDFTRNIGGHPIRYDQLAPEAYVYLKQAGALAGTPIEGLNQMNRPAIGYYGDHGVDLYQERLEIAVCAQHNNGGISTDFHWETDIHGLLAVGKVCGSHGVTRPGGTALNVDQAGAVRAAEWVRQRKLYGLRQGGWPEKDGNKQRETGRILREDAYRFIEIPELACGTEILQDLWLKAAKQMSAYGGTIREGGQVQAAPYDTRRELTEYLHPVKQPGMNQLPLFYRLRDMLISQMVYLSSMLDYCKSSGGSRGSVLYTNGNGRKPDGRLPDLFKRTLDNGSHVGVIQEVICQGTEYGIKWRPVRPVSEVDYFSENQWKLYRERIML